MTPSTLLNSSFDTYGCALLGFGLGVKFLGGVGVNNGDCPALTALGGVAKGCSFGSTGGGGCNGVLDFASEGGAGGNAFAFFCGGAICSCSRFTSIVSSTDGLRLLRCSVLGFVREVQPERGEIDLRQSQAALNVRRDARTPSAANQKQAKVPDTTSVLSKT